MSVQKLLEGKGASVPVIRSGLTLEDVINQMDIDKSAALVVTDNNQNILGIITERDIARGLKMFGRNFVEKPLRDLMTTNVITCDINQPLVTILELMDKYQIQCVPITRDGLLCGIINMFDLVKYRLEEIEYEANELKAYVAGNR
jgi:CBS domain-containing protein